MNKLKALTLSVLLISLAIAPAYALRQDWDYPFAQHGKRSGQIGQLKQELDLTQQQQVELKRVRTESKQETATLRAETASNREVIRNLFNNEPLDEQRLRELSHEQAERHADMMIAKHTAQEKINQILTPEQQQKYETFRQKKMGIKTQRRCDESATGQEADR